MTLVADFTQDGLATVPDRSITGRRLVAGLDQIIEQRGWPASVVSDNRTKPTSMAIPRWRHQPVVEKWPGNSAFRLSRDWARSKRGADSTLDRLRSRDRATAP